MADLTDEEYDALDEYWTTHTPKVSGNGKSGFFARHQEEGDTLVFLDHLSATWIRIKANAAHKSQTEIISELVREKITASA
ncbi:MAG: hypothetical protein Ta2B_12210 [Termitinemataceae bacterium]|nr:MAG: hypothetical protein Ta2B_12210 [Termitinemataceae bacterium]